MSNSSPFADKLISNIERVIIGKTSSVEEAVICLLSEGHLLIEDVPGVGKTMLARSLARSLGCSFRRIQFTPDMLPTDVTGVSIYNRATQDFEFRPGPLMAQIVLTDEINRATPKAQSSLLEAMQERQVTVDGVSHPLPHPFMVLATQNPLEYEGTFPLPEAQKDRFLMRVRIGYPSAEDEASLLSSQKFHHPIEELDAVADAEELRAEQRRVKAVYVSPAVESYIVSLLNETRDHPEVTLGGSPRGGLGLYRASQARAVLQQREYVLPDDIKAMASSVLAHRLILAPGARLRKLTADALLSDILKRVPVPGFEEVRASQEPVTQPR